MLEFLLLGLAVGATYALAAMGLVLVFRGSGVVNFANGGFAIVGAYAYDEAHRHGGLPAAAAIAVALAATGVLAALVHIVVMRPMKASSPLVRAVATLGILTAVQAAAILRYGGNVAFVPSPLPHGPVTVVGVALTADRLWLIGIAAALAAALWALYRFTMFGLATSAVAENERAAAALGRSPDRVATVNWALGGVLAGSAGVLLAPVTGLSVSQLGLLLMPALAAALIGGFSSFGLTLAGALAIGVGQSELTRYVSLPGLPASLPFVVIVAVLVVRGHALPVRGFVADRLPAVGSGRATLPRALAVLAVGGLVLLLLGDAWAQALTTTCASALICLSVVVVTGYTGQLSLAQYALAGVGAFIAARLSAAAGVSFWLAAPAGILGAVPVGMLVGLPSLRTRGVSLGIATLGLALALQNMVFANTDLTGGLGGTVVQLPSLLGFSLSAVDHPQRYGALCLLVLIVAGVLVANARRGALGRILIAVRSNERAAASLGVEVRNAKLTAFAIGSALAAAGGVLIAFQAQTVRFDAFGVVQSIQMVVLTVLGGLGFVAGAGMGGLAAPGAVVSYGSQQLTSSDQWLALATGVLLVVSVVLVPDGAASHLARIARRLRLVRPPRRDAAVPPPRMAARRGGGLLRVERLGMRFGEVVALDGVTLEARPGEVLGLIGANGAGKTTFIDAVTGISAPTAGRVLLDGEDVTRRPAAARARRGLVRSFQSLELFEDLTVRDNLGVAAAPRQGLAMLRDFARPRPSELPAAATAALRELRLEGELDTLPSGLSYGHRRLVAIARSLAADPAVLLLDEPAAGLDATERAELGRLLRWVADELGIAVLLVEHDVGLVVEVCDRLAVLDFGRLIATGTPREVCADEAVVAAYLGADHAAEALPVAGAPEEGA